MLLFLSVFGLVHGEGCRLGLATGNLDVAAVPFDVLPMEPPDFSRSDSREGTDGEERKQAGMAGDEHLRHLIGRENGDLGFRGLERLGHVGNRVAVGVEIPLALGEAEHADDGAPKRVAAHRSERLLLLEKPVDVGRRHVRDIPFHLACEAPEVVPAIPDMDLAVAPNRVRIDWERDKK